MLFIDYNVHLRTPVTPTPQLNHLGLNIHLCSGVDPFLPGRPQTVGMGNRPLLHHSKYRSTTGLCVASSPLLPPHTHNSKPSYEPNTIRFFGWHRCERLWELMGTFLPSGSSSVGSPIRTCVSLDGSILSVSSVGVSVLLSMLLSVSIPTSKAPFLVFMDIL